MKKVIALVAAAFVIIGCASVVRELDQGAVGKIQQGITKSQVLDLIGIPDKAFYTGDGDVIWSYIYVPAPVKAAAVIPAVSPPARVAKTQQQSLTITFGPDGVVKNITSAEGGKEADTKLSPGGKVDMPNIEENKSPK